jgi:type IV secretory pathway ATPase VirB11/archaellum biosynthesis ATPase
MGNTEVTVFSLSDSVQNLYHIIPPEFKLTEDKYDILDTARKIMSEHKPKKSEFVDPDRMREVFFKVGHDLIEEVCGYKKIKLKPKEIDELTNILVRYTVGFGLIELLLQDQKVQDITINSPMGQTPIFLIHEEFGDCKTNIIPTVSEAESWASKLRMISGRPLDEANPILDTQLEIGKIRARIAIVQNPLSPDGLAYSIRRHRENPWTLPLFIENKMLNPLGAGLLSFLIDGARTLLVAGTRSSGKTSLLGSLMLEINPKSRIITIEDSLELPVESMRKLGYNILRMKVRSALLKSTSEVSADDGIRTSLRLGDSSLIVGEVRSVEAKALYEAMRVGALANVVAGTIHGASPYAVFDRVVNDLEVPITSFKATDVIAVANPIKSADGLYSWRRLLQISEIRKHWQKDPLEEKGFIDLMSYSVEKDELEPTDDLINGESEVIKEVASKFKGWAGNWDAVYDNILLRAKIKNEIVETAKKINNPEILEADFNKLVNHEFHKISESVIKEIGLPLSTKVFPLWKKWMSSEIKKRGF